jgi:hypothetical protein
MRLTKRQLRTAVNKLIREDSVDTELDHLRKNVADDLDHIKDLHDDVEEDHEEEMRAEKEKHKHESRRRGSSKKVGYHQLRRIIREQSIEVHHHYDQGYDDREDERLAAEHGGEDDHDEQDYADRRDDAGFEERNEALKRRLRRIVRENTRSPRRRRR